VNPCARRVCSGGFIDISDLTDSGVDEAMRERDEFNFSVNLQLSEAPISYVRQQLVALTREQHDRKATAA
jgi:anaerobic magnesium-protoporphyrin IX monomethyl ester cyclase